MNSGGEKTKMFGKVLTWGGRTLNLFGSVFMWRCEHSYSKRFLQELLCQMEHLRAATHIRLVPGGGGVKTAYPLIP